MQDFHLRTDLQRVTIDGFALALGIAPRPGRLKAPQQGYTVSFVPARDDEPDTYSFHAVVSHEKVAPLVRHAFEFLPDEVFAIVEIGSRDAYRSTDTYISDEPISRDDFLEAWRDYEPFLLEDSCIAAGANSEEPFIEVFIDQWKGVAIHVPPEMREEVEAMLQEHGLEEVIHTWPDKGPDELSADADSEDESPVRSVLDLRDEHSPDVDELLLDLRHCWKLELNIDPESNVDEGGRDLGSTLWHAMVIVDRIHNGENSHNGDTHAENENNPSRSAITGNQGRADFRSAANTDRNDGPARNGGYASIWATAGSISQMEQMIQTALDRYPDWAISEVFTIDRVAFDERPDELADLKPQRGRREPEIHLVVLEPWTGPEQD